MHPAKRWYWDTLGERIVKALKKNRIEARYFQDREKATRFILEQIPLSAKVGVSGSVTIRELGLIEQLEKRGNPLVHHWKPELGHDEAGGRVESVPPGTDLGVRREALNSQVYLCSTNAVTLDGKLVNVDGHGNRAAAMIFGPEEVMVVAGMNKAVKDVPAAMERIKTFTAPISAHRGRAKVPCAETTLCVDCDSPERSCSVTTIIEKCPKGGKIRVVLVGEELGF